MQTESIREAKRESATGPQEFTGSSDGRATPGQEQQVQEHFDRVAGRYASWYTGNSIGAHSFTVRLHRVLEMLPPKVGTLLDLGCGPGLLFERLQDGQAKGTPGGTQFVGMDFAGKMVLEANARVNANGRLHATFLRGEASRLPFSDKSIDTLTCMGLMEYLDDEDLTLQEIARVLSPGGTAIITLPNLRSPYRRWHRLMHRLFAGSRKTFPGIRHIGTIESILGPFGQDVVSHREYTEGSYGKRLSQFGLKPVDICYYNFKVALTPIDKWLPQLTLKLSRRMENLARGPLRFMATAFIIKARKD